MDAASDKKANPLIVVWGLGGVVVVLVQAVYRLTQLALQPIEAGMAGWQWGLLIGWVILNGYAEGHRGFHLRFSPRVVARAFHLAKNPRPLHVLLAPLFCMSFFHASRRGLIVAYVLTAGIVLLVSVVRIMPQPYRGIVDAGVVVGLVWGTASIGVHLLRALKNGATAPPDLPG